MTEPAQFPTFDGPSLDKIEQRILDATIEPATAGGYDAVRQRDVALKAKVALATVYTRFSSKDVLLAAALELDNRRWMGELRKRPIRGRTPLARVTKLFSHMTELWLERPQLARASLHAATSGDHEAMLRQMIAQQRINLIIVDALRGPKDAPAMRREPALRVATVLTMVWFSNLTAWAAGIVDTEMAVDIVRQAAEMLLHGVLNEPHET
jgi:AcrR family transcriptional regulator